MFYSYDIMSNSLCNNYGLCFAVQLSKGEAAVGIRKTNMELAEKTTVSKSSF